MGLKPTLELLVTLSPRRPVVLDEVGGESHAATLETVSKSSMSPIPELIRSGRSTRTVKTSR